MLALGLARAFRHSIPISPVTPAAVEEPSIRQSSVQNLFTEIDSRISFRLPRTASNAPVSSSSPTFGRLLALLAHSSTPGCAHKSPQV
ncbi:hypothetical protein BOTBODRAFT_251205 [Botryobasidium botryosum FD-172 SS1]|uniref:Uncharacterized protein n=1 Tax=Botryobasidium botryosum (strain FD-172 SS1) TaxID=930990 RepID=A0A067MLT0_BOTB1|nr:hypothetical protein BOTBODRAFT_251205 [Botryobasidium botryosum FD-172 SS1]